MQDTKNNTMDKSIIPFFRSDILEVYDEGNYLFTLDLVYRNKSNSFRIFRKGDVTMYVTLSPYNEFDFEMFYYKSDLMKELSYSEN